MILLNIYNRAIVIFKFNVFFTDYGIRSDLLLYLQQKQNVLNVRKHQQLCVWPAC